MKSKKTIPTVKQPPIGPDLRQRAEDLIEQKGGISAGEDPSDYRLTLQELQIHQVELELQNQELHQAHLEAELARRKYFELYDLAPIGYASFNEKGAILEINLAGAQLLDQERRFLIDRRFQLFLAPDSVPAFNRFNQEVFSSGRRQFCEVALVKNGGHPSMVRLEGVRMESGEEDKPFCQAAFLDITEQKKAERALQENLEHYQSLVQALPGVIFETDAQGNNTFISDRWTQWTGMTRGETLDQGWRKAIPAEDAEAESTRWRESVRTGQPLSYQARLLNMDGLSRWVLLRAIPTRDGEGNIVRWTGTLTDINELLQAQEALRTKEAELSLVMDAVPALIASVNTDGRYLRVNRSYAQWFGSTVEEIQGKRMSDVLGEDQWKQIEPWVEKVLSGETITYERQLPFQRGALRWIRASYTPDFNERGRIKGFVVHVIDIEDIKRGEEALKNSEENYRRILETANEGIVIGSLSGRMDFINQKWAEMLGYSKEELIGQIGLDFMDEDQKSMALDTRENLLKGERVTREYKFRRKDGSELWTLCSSSLFQDAEGNNSGYLGMHVDITDRKKAEQSLRESLEDLNRAQAVAHTGSWRLDIQHNELHWTEETHRIFGIPSGTPLTYEVFLGTIHPDDRSYVERKWMAALGGKPYDVEHRIVADGNIKWVRELAELEVDVEGGVRGGFGTVQDITERKEAEERLRKSEARFLLLSRTAGRLLASPVPQQEVEELCSRVMEHLDCQVFFNFLVDGPRGRLHLNACAGIPEEEARKIEWLDFGVAVCGCVARDRERMVAEDIFQQPDIRTDLVRSFGVQAYACHPIKAGDHLLGTLSFGTRTRSSFSSQDLELMKTVTDQVATAMEKMTMLAAIQSARDVLETRVQERTAELDKAYEDLAKQSMILESFFQGTITPLVFLDRDFNFIRVNAAYARACQRTIADFQGHNHFEFYPHEENETIFRRVVETGIPYQAQAKPFSFPDHPEWGVTYWDWTLTPIRDDKGELVFLVFSLEEVTDRQAAEESLRLSERQLRTLAEQLLTVQEKERRQIARDMHDSLGSSLGALKYKMEDLIHHLPERDIQQVGETLGSLVPVIQQIMGETRRMQKELRPPLLDDLGILPTLSWYSREFQKINPSMAIEQQSEVSEEDIPGMLKVVIFRIIQEAFNNISKHSQATRIRISLRRKQDQLKLAIEDDGQGFDAKALRTLDFQTTGMGLSSMKERAELSGGLFSIKSFPGKGTKVEVSWMLKSGRGGEKD